MMIMASSAVRLVCGLKITMRHLMASGVLEEELVGIEAHCVGLEQYISN